MDEPWDFGKKTNLGLAWTELTPIRPTKSHPTSAREDNMRALHTQWGQDPPKRWSTPTVVEVPEGFKRIGPMRIAYKDPPKDTLPPHLGVPYCAGCDQHHFGTCLKKEPLDPVVQHLARVAQHQEKKLLSEAAQRKLQRQNLTAHPCATPDLWVVRDQYGNITGRFKWVSGIGLVEEK